MWYINYSLVSHVSSCWNVLYRQYLIIIVLSIGSEYKHPLIRYIYATNSLWTYEFHSMIPPRGNTRKEKKRIFSVKVCGKMTRVEWSGTVLISLSDITRPVDSVDGKCDFWGRFLWVLRNFLNFFLIFFEL